MSLRRARGEYNERLLWRGTFIQPAAMMNANYAAVKRYLSNPAPVLKTSMKF